MKKVFYFVGAGLVVGTVAVTAVYLLSGKKKKECVSCHDYKVPGEERASTEVTISKDEPVYQDVKGSAIGSMYSRHEGAITIMSESVEVIRENVKISGDTNDEIDDVSVDLDKMLSED